MSGGAKTAKPEQSASGKIVTDLYGRGPLKSALESSLSPTSLDAYAQRAGTGLVQGVRSGYGARGLAGSGIAQKGEQDALTGLMTDLAMKKEGNAAAILGTGGGLGSTTPIPGRGFMGLK